MSVFIRILLRYIAMALVTKGWLSADDAASISGDQELISMIEMGLGAVLASITEVWHWIERKWRQRDEGAK